MTYLGGFHAPANGKTALSHEPQNHYAVEISRPSVFGVLKFKVFNILFENFNSVCMQTAFCASEWITTNLWMILFF